MKYFAFVALLFLGTVLPMFGQSFTFTITGKDAGEDGQTLAFGVNTAATFCEDTLLGERNNYSFPPFPFNFTWGNPRTHGPCDDNDCFSCGRMSDKGNPPLDLRPFINTAQIDTYRVSMYSYLNRVRSWPFELTWTPNFSINCDSMKLQYTGNTAGAVSADMFQDSSHTITDGSVEELYIIKWGAKSPSVLTINPDNINFGYVAPGSHDSISVTASNGGTSPISVDSMYFTNDAFHFTNELKDSGVAAGGIRIFNAIFSPTDTGLQTGNIIIQHTGLNSPDTITLTGIGGRPPHILLTFSPDSVNFGNALVGNNLILPVIATNQGTTDMTVSGIYSTNSEFGFTGELINDGVLPPGGSRTFYVNFSPSNYGDRSGLIIISHTGQYWPDSLLVFGVGGSATAAFSVSTDSLLFPVSNIGTPKLLTATVHNKGIPTLEITTVLSDNPQFTVAPLTASITTGNLQVFSVMYTPSSSGTTTGNIIFTHNGLSSPDTVIAQGDGRVIVILHPRWNIISNPEQVQNDSLKAIFAGSLYPYCYSFSGIGGYQQQAQLLNGFGYWGKFENTQTVAFYGEPILTDSFPVTSGWNMIGSISDPVLTSSILPISTTIVSPFFGYSSGYQITDTIKPGKGYWVHVSTDGQLVLSSEQNMEKATRGQGHTFDSRRFSSIRFTDANGNLQTLFFTGKLNEGIELDYYTVPPPPPDGEFDIRYSSGRLLEQMNNDSPSIIPLQLSGINYPLLAEWSVSEELKNMALRVGTKNIPIAQNGSYTIHTAEPLALISNNAENQAAKFSLHQNYPNPFNPATTISYTLPSEGFVTLKIYNSLGQEVATLINRVENAGVHGVNFDASSLPSGFYSYRLVSGSFIETKQMMVMK